MAVLAVMLAHFGSIMPGGFVGVDVFFIISGFVITLSLNRLWNDVESTKQVLLTFYIKRFFRLVPVLTVVITVTLLFSFILLPIPNFNVQAEMSIWSLFFAGNIGAEFLDGGGYFTERMGPNWLLHLWSLGVEEQFYLVFPFLFILLVSLKGVWGKKKGTLLLGALLLLAFIPAILNELDSLLDWGGFFAQADISNALFGYYSPVARAWQFLVGVMAAHLVTVHKPSSSSRQAPLWSLLALLLTILIFPESELHPGPLMLIPTLFVFLLLVFPLSFRDSTSIYFQPLRWLGDRSYSAYLWHWPVWSVFSIMIANQQAVIALSFFFTLALSWLSYKYIERSPFFSPQTSKNHQNPPSPLVRRFFSLGLAANLALIPTFVLSTQVFIEEKLNETGLSAPEVPRFDESLNCITSDCKAKGVEALLVGDSHAGALFDSLHRELADIGIHLGALIQPGCFHLQGERVGETDSECVNFSNATERVIKDLEPKWIFIHGYTAGRLTTLNSGSQTLIQLQRSDGVAIGDENSSETYGLAVSEFLGKFANSETNIWFISSLPDFKYNLTTPLLNGEPTKPIELLSPENLDFQQGSIVTREEFLVRHGGFLSIEKDAARREKIYQSSPWSYVCLKEICQQKTVSGDFVFADSDHLSQVGADLLSEGISGEVRKVRAR
jgi:peptidoglycan/LPS O-acetylase OafA/YrhL